MSGWDQVKVAGNGACTRIGKRTLEAPQTGDPRAPSRLPVGLGRSYRRTTKRRRALWQSSCAVRATHPHNEFTPESKPSLVHTGARGTAPTAREQHRAMPPREGGRRGGSPPSPVAFLTPELHRALRCRFGPNSQGLHRHACVTGEACPPPIRACRRSRGPTFPCPGPNPKRRAPARQRAGAAAGREGPSRVPRYLCRTRGAAGPGRALPRGPPLRTRTGSPPRPPRRCGTSWAAAARRSPPGSPTSRFLMKTRG